MANRIDYNSVMREITGGGKLLLHVCCAPCTSGVIHRLGDFDVTAYYFNPNIDTTEEYERRREQFAKLGMDPIVEEYDHGEFLRAVSGTEDAPEGGERCRKCIYMRLRRTAEKAKELGAEWFCSTLSVSPHKDAQYINETGVSIGKKYGVKFLPNDFKKENGFLISTERSKALGIYRQDYCGCEFAKRRDKE